MKRLFALLLAAVLAVGLAGCGSPQDILNQAMGAGNGPGGVSAKDGYAEGRIGDTLSSVFFDFSVDSAEFVDEYAGYAPAAGNVLLDTVVTVKNTFGEELPMFNSDFQIQWGDGDEDYGYGVEGLTDSAIMPEEYTLKRAESVTYHVVYEVPAGSSNFSVSFLEYFEDETEGDVFFIFFELDPVESPASGVAL